MAGLLEPHDLSQGTGRCRLPIGAIQALEAKPGDAVVVQMHASQKAFLCSLHMLANMGPKSNLPVVKAQVDCCIQIPAARYDGEKIGDAIIRSLKANLGTAQSVTLRGEGINTDPSPSLRVAIAAALEHHVSPAHMLPFCRGHDVRVCKVVCRGSLLNVPTVGMVSVAGTSPDNGAVTVVAKTRVSFQTSSSAPSTPSTNIHAAPLQSSPSPATPNRIVSAAESPTRSASPMPSWRPHSETLSTPPPPSTPSNRSRLASRSPSKPLVLPFSPHSPLARSSHALSEVSRPPRAEDEFCGEESVVQELREMLRLVFDRQESLQAWGMRPSGGVLIHGPPGTGKKLLVRAVAAEVQAKVVAISPSEVYGAGAGEGEAMLRERFRAAREEGRVVVVLLDVHRLCPKRQSGREREARVVGQMLSLLDGGKSDRLGVAVVGLTTRPQALDLAMRRPGRLDRELALRPPSVDARLDMLRRFSQHLPLADHGRLPEVAAMCVGFVGADLRALCTRVVGTCLSRTLVDADAPATVSFEDWERGVQGVQAHGTNGRNGLSTEEGKEGLSGVGGLADVKDVLRRAVEWPLRHRDAFQRMGVRASRGVLLHGPPGCGKTKLVRAVAHTAGVGFIQASGAEVMSCLLGESERIVRELFARGRGMRPCVLFIDEIDALVASRALDGSGDGGESAGVQQRLLSTLLNEMDGVEEAEGVLLVGATNRLDMIDPALLRPGRFDHLLAVPLPDQAGREDVLGKCCRSMCLAPEVQMEQIARATVGYSGAELERVAMEAAMVALRRDISTKDLCVDDFEKAVRRVLPAGGGSEKDL